MLRFAEVFPDPGIVHALRSQLSWTHLREIIALDDPLQRRFYVELCRLEAWSTRTLQEKIAGMLYERTAIAKRPDAVVEQALATLSEEGRTTPDLVFRDPYVLDFLGLPADFSERAQRAVKEEQVEVVVVRADGHAPPRALLEKKLLDAVAHARARLGAAPSEGEPR
jgi:DUF1016 N-terminal domain